jgi:hypothetical protein
VDECGENKGTKGAAQPHLVVLILLMVSSRGMWKVSHLHQLSPWAVARERGEVLGDFIL